MTAVLITTGLFLFVGLYQIYKGSKSAAIFIFVWLALLTWMATHSELIERWVLATPLLVILAAALSLLILLTLNQREAVEKSQAEVRQLLAELNKRTDEERVRISREIHDVVNQKLFAVRLGLKNLLGSEVLPKQHTKELKQLASDTHDAYLASRGIIQSIRVEVLDAIGLYGSIADLVVHYNTIAPNMHFAFDADETLVSNVCDKHTMNTYRIIQEALLNTVKHSGATNVSITATKNSNTSLVFSIRDNGKGIAKKLSSGLGIIDMRERALCIGSKLQIDSNERGTVVSFVVPLSTQH